VTYLAPIRAGRAGHVTTPQTGKAYELFFLLINNE